ncbi:MAG: hypothetical protein ACRDV9_13895 [Acidimicrobiia bacterium]
MPPFHAQDALVAERLDQLDHEKGVSSRRSDLTEQPRPRRPTGQGRGECGNLLGIDLAQPYKASTAGDEATQGGVQLGCPRKWAQRHHECHRQLGEGAADRPQRPQGGRFRPVQVVEGEHQG